MNSNKMRAVVHTKYGSPDVLELKEVNKPIPKYSKVKTVIDKCYQLSEVPEALRYLEEGHARGKVIIQLDCNK
jgi:NADPH:quinone reductase-like Zn-dependent oxidoreductase